MNERIRIEIDDHVALVTLTRPERHNALDPPMFAAIRDAAQRLTQAPDVRAVVLKGDGPSFCSGLDVALLKTLAQDVDFSNEEGLRANRAQRICTAWMELPVPVIAAIHGACFGGGLQMALGADMRIATPDARLNLREVRYGLVPDLGVTSTLPRLMQVDVAKELIYTARTINGREALAAGLVTRLDSDPVGAAHELARQIAASSPDAVRAAKRLLEEAWPAGGDAGLALEWELQRSLIGGVNQVAAVAAGVDPTTATFTDPVG